MIQSENRPLQQEDRADQMSQAMEERMNALYMLADRVATLSAAIIAFTVTFARSMAQSAPSYSPMSLKISWLCFLVAVCGFFLIHAAKIALHGRVLRELRRGGAGLTTIVPPWYFHFGRWFLFVGFLGGLVLLALYGFQSL